MFTLKLSFQVMLFGLNLEFYHYIIMRHLKKGRKFHREAGLRKALLRSLSHNLIVYKKIKTTEAKAKELKPLIEKIITKAKNSAVESHRLVFKKIPNKNDVKKIFTDIAPKYKERKGGYTRIIKLPLRRNDKAKMAIIEFV